MELEKNDVDISKLFNWGKAFELVGDDGVEVIVYMRVLGDADVNKARVHALRESAKLRRALRDNDSDERLVYVKDIEELTKENLINYVILFSTRELTQKMWKQVKIKPPKQPKSDAPLEELEAYQKEVDEFPKKREETIRESLEKETNNLKKNLNSKNKQELYKMYVSSLVNELCEQRAIMSFREMSVYLGCYKDNEYKEKFFDSLDEFLNLGTDQKVEFLSAYQSLEMGTEEIKKLREAMP